MKNLLRLVTGILFVSFVFTSCTENTVTDDEQVIMETQGIDQPDSVNPGGNGQGEDDSNEEE